MTPEEELELVRQAILLGRIVHGCFEWDDQALFRVQDDPDLKRFTPAVIRKLTIEHVVASGIIRQVKEQRPEYDDHDYYYKVILSAAEFRDGLFVEMRLIDPDVDCPTVLLVNAHPQRN